MSQAVFAVIAIVGVGAAILAYVSNMLCEPFKLCWPPSAVAALPQEPGSVTPGEYAEAISKELGLEGLPEIDENLGRVTKGSTISESQFQKAFEDLAKTTPLVAGIPSATRVPRTPLKKVTPIKLSGGGHISLMGGACRKKYGASSCWSVGLARCVPCGSTAAKFGYEPLTFAESEDYAPRVA